MAALLKKRALAEYRNSTVLEEPPRPLKRLQIVKRKSTEQNDLDLSAFESQTNYPNALQVCPFIYPHKITTFLQRVIFA